MEARTVKEVLVAAKWIIENVGWCKGELAKDKDGQYTSTRRDLKKIACVCSVGAIDVVKTTQDLKSRAIRALEDVNHFPYGVTNWNDDMKTTKKDVVRAFERAIKAEENK